MKKLLALFLAMLMALSLAGCGLSSNLGDVGGSVGSTDDDQTGVGYPEDGYAEGFVGDTMHTAFFDFTVDNAYSCTEFDGIAAQEDSKFVVVEITLTNTTTYTQPMFDTDFQIQWDVQEGEDEAEAYDWPLFTSETDAEGETVYSTLSDLQLPVEWDLNIGQTQSGILLYSVPAGSKSYSISFQEYFSSEEEGDLFFVWFSAPEQ